MARTKPTPPPAAQETAAEDRPFSLIPDPHNANRGTPRGREMVRSSIRDFGAGRSVLADRNGVLIAGNKTAREAQALGLPTRVIETDGSELVVVRRTDLDINDPRGRMLAYADNRTSEVGLDWDADQIVKDFEEGLPLDVFFNEQEIRQIYEGLDADLPDEEPETFEGIRAELAGAAALKKTMNFASNEVHGIPPLRDDMLGDLPDDIKVWAGPDASDRGHDGWWLYCYGSDSVRGLNWGQTALCFYVDDYRFEPWWLEPDQYVGRALNVGLNLAITPNYSLWGDEAEAIHIWNTYRARWLGRYMQEAGIRVIPDVNWAMESSFEFCLAGIPKHAPCIAIQVQNGASDAEMKRKRYGVMTAIDRLQPQKLLIYGGGADTRKALAAVIPNGLPVIWLESRSAVRAEAVMKHGSFRADG